MADGAVLSLEQQKCGYGVQLLTALVLMDSANQPCSGPLRELSGVENYIFHYNRRSEVNELS